MRKLARLVPPSPARAKIIALAKDAETVASVMALPAQVRGAKEDALKDGVDGLKQALGLPTSGDTGASDSLKGVGAASVRTHALLAQSNGSISIVTIIKETARHYTCHYLGNDKQPFKVNKAGKDRKVFFGSTQEAADWVEAQKELNRAARHEEPIPNFIQEGSREWRRRESLILAERAPKIMSCHSCGSPRPADSRCQFCDGFTSEWSLNVKQTSGQKAD
ncbi:hypothetical protein [Burkholderia sp. Ac-20365]|uniref:hypothetical protein n=1 Tax=Burkholderia sp. Ac-20365 TaxID=2703897 RepID=UPI00197B8428|nr:hypothetical protein [Burkholderia sp. Ac-20365]MBN3761016.1 hypothetical protein [Burkholderia sp. Ac-20365]